ncbi:MAG: hypothetical protein K2Q26_11295 [Bdellovibrionales bacterium]|nr:hypothetical protein [Bdellovibrionales bacterium]
MSLNSKQVKIKEKLHLVTKDLKAEKITYRTEWLGFIPFGVYSHVECAGKDISKELPSEWELADFIALEKAGHLQKLEEWRNPQDEHDSKIVFQLKAS